MMADVRDVLSPEEAIRLAVAEAGADDFGAEGWREGLSRSLDAFSRLPLKDDVRRAANRKIVQDLVTRLRIERWYKDHPEVENQVIEGPVVVVGLPRTGTTATVAMLARDERFRFLRAWEASAPLPPPVAGEEDSDPRVIAARKAAAEYGMAHMHLHDPDGPEEDLAMLSGLDMHAYHGAFPMPDDYLAWWMGGSHASYYAYQERVLKLLQSARPPGLWLLKSPPHLFWLDEIVARYPNARFVMTHRDPAKVISSVASLYSALHEERCRPGAVDREAEGRTSLAFWAEGMKRGLAARDRLGEDRFIDVKNDDVVKRPVETFERIYDFLGLPLTPGLARRLESYNRDNAPGAFGKHRHAPEDFGLTAGTIRAAFGEYIDRFDL